MCQTQGSFFSFWRRLEMTQVVGKTKEAEYESTRVTRAVPTVRMASVAEGAGGRVAEAGHRADAICGRAGSGYITL